MSKPSKHPAPKSKKPAPKRDGTTKEKAAKDAAPATVPAPKTKPAAVRPRDPRLPAPGTTTTREYKGKVLKVKYLDDGVEVDGTRHDSLSAAARAVTGAASINGFLWFGLTKPRVAAPKPAPTAPKDAAAKVGNGNDIGTAAGQREALAALLGKKPGRPISKPRATSAGAK